MLFIGVFGATITLSQVFSDIIGILNGSITTAGGLSASFANSSTFFSTIAPGWTSYDTAAGGVANSVTPCVIRAPYSDDGTKYKNVYINSLSSTQLGFNGFETWNSGTHTGTFPMVTAGAAASTWQALNLTSATYTGGKLIISASANHFYIQTYTSTNVVGDTIFVSEFSRDDPWNTVANGYTPWLQTGSQGAGNSVTLANTSIPRLLNPATLSDTASGTILLGNNCSLAPQGMLSSTNAVPCGLGQVNAGCPPITLGAQGADSSKASGKYLFPIAIRQITSGALTPYAAPFLGGNLSAVNGFVYYAPQSTGAANDDFAVGSDTYLLLVPANASAARVAVLKK